MLIGDCLREFREAKHLSRENTSNNLREKNSSLRLKSRLVTFRVVTSPIRNPQTAAIRHMSLNGWSAAFMTRAAVSASKKNACTFGLRSTGNSRSLRFESGIR